MRHQHHPDSAVEKSDLYPANGADVAAVQAIGQSKDRGQQPDPAPILALELAELAMFLLRLGPAMVSRHVSDEHLLFRRNAKQLGV
jgi:hypothetical protein